MLVIRDAQLLVLGKAARKRFLRKAARHLAAHFPRARALPEAALRAFVERGVAALERQGLVAENDLVKGLGVLLVLGEDALTAQPWAKAILASDAGPTLKANRLVLRALTELRLAEARQEGAT